MSAIERIKSVIFSNIFKKQRYKEYKIGQTIRFGRYPQICETNVEPIEWIILDIYDNVALLISKLCIIPSGYCDIYKIRDDVDSLQWKNSLAREICNSDFYNTAFNDKEKQVMCKRLNQSEGVGHSCSDFVFLLSESEIVKYLPTSEDRVASATEYAKSKGAGVGWCGYEKYSSWWLMPQHEDVGTRYIINGKEYSESIYPKAVFHNGEIQYHSRNVYHSDFTIRPCIQINTSEYKKLL